MKDSHKDQELQKILDNGYVSPDKENDPEMKVYQSLYEALEQPLGLTIPQDFSQKVAARVIQISDQRSHRFWLLSGLAVALSLLFIGVVLYFSSPTYFNLILNYSEMIAFAGLLFIAIQVADYRLIQRKLLFN